MSRFRFHMALAVAGSLLPCLGLAQRAPVELLTPRAVAGPVAPTHDVDKVVGQPVPTAASAQPAGPRQARPASPWPLVLVNEHIIVGNRSLVTTGPKDIKDIEVRRDFNAVLRWGMVANGGVVSITLKRGVRLPASVSLARLKRQQHLTGKVRYELDGRPLADTALRLVAADIEKLEVKTEPDGSKVLAIRFFPRIEVPSHYPPGTIFIRGVAAR